MEKNMDKELEALWAELEDVPFDEEENGRLVLAEPWHDFPAGTDRETIWYYFDERHSKGVAFLLYGGTTEGKKELSKLAIEGKRCFECMAEHCAFNPRGICRFPLVYGTLPEQDEDNGCLDMCAARDTWEE